MAADENLPECLECHCATDEIEAEHECVVPHCEQPVRLHPQCVHKREFMLCKYHMIRYRNTRSTRWLVGLSCGTMLVGGTFLIGYGSAALFNGMAAYFSYGPVMLLPRHLQVMVHGLGWLSVGGAWSLWKQHTVRPPLQRRGAQRHLQLADDKEEHKQTVTSHCIVNMDTKRGTDTMAAMSHTKVRHQNSHVQAPAKIQPYYNSDWGGLVALGAQAALFSLYQVWKHMYTHGCQALGADVMAPYT